MAFSAQGAFGGAMGGAQMGSAFGPWGAAIGGILGGIGGGFLGGDSSSKVAKDLLGRQMDRQEIWMKNQMLWRVEDAKKAGIHPLAAIGSNVTAPSVPGVAVGDSGGGDLGSVLASSGQSIGRELSAYMSGVEKDKTIMRALEIESAELDNTMKREQLNRLRAVGSPPDFPNLGINEHWPMGISDPSRYPRGDIIVRPLDQPALQASGLVDVTRPEVMTTIPGMPGTQSGSNPDVQFYQDNQGNWFYNPSEKFKADDMGAPGTIQWFMRNRMLPALPYIGQTRHEGVFPRPPKGPPKGSIGWILNPVTGRMSPAYPGEQWHPFFIPDSDERR